MLKHILACILLASPRDIVAFTAAGAPHHHSISTTALSSTTSTQDDLLKPAYEVEPIAIRIGHGFDIHRMAPIQDAGQPIVIGGVEITHKDQKVSFFYGSCICVGFHCLNGVSQT